MDNVPAREDEIFRDLTARFSFLADSVKVVRPRRISVDVGYDHFRSVLDHAVRQLNFAILCTITGLDEGQTIGAIYHVARLDGIVMNIHTHVPKDKPVIRTVTDIFPDADIYEREMVDLLGVSVQGLAEGKRYPLPDDWPLDQHPLRKDWKATGTEGKGSMEETDHA